MMNCGLNTSNGADGNRQQDFDWQNWSAEPGKGARVQYANAKTWKTFLGAHHRIRLLHQYIWPGPQERQ